MWFIPSYLLVNIINMASMFPNLLHGPSLRSSFPYSLNLLVLIFRELDDDLQDSLYDFLEARGIDDKLTEFLHKYMRSKDKNEYLRWMDSLKTYIQKK